MDVDVSYRRDGDRITIELTPEQYDLLCISMGAATAALPVLSPDLVALMNAIGDGNPNYRPYEIPNTLAEQLKAAKNVGRMFRELRGEP